MTRYAGTDPEVGAMPSASGLPPRYLPRVAGYARGPWIDPRLVTPTEFRWRNARTYILEDYDGVEWRCVRITVPGGHHAGWWAVELLGLPLLGEPEPIELVTGLVVELADGRTIQLPVGWRVIEE